MDKWFNNNNFTKILALAISVLLWAMVHSNDVTPTPTTTASVEPRVIDNIKIEPYGIDSSKYVLTSLDTTEVEMQVRGQRSVLTSIFTDEYKVRLDLSDVEPGTSTLPLSHVVPNGVEFVSMEPSTVTVTVEELASNTFNVSIVPQGEPAAGYLAGDPVITSADPVKVTLPESQLAAVGKIEGTVDIDGATETVSEKRVRLKAYDLDGNEIKGAVIEPESVAVDIPITEQFTKVPFKVHYTGQLPEGLTLSQVEPNISEVTLYGSQDILAGIESYDGVTLDLSQITEAGTHTVNVDLTPPSGFEKIEPSSVQLKVTVVSSEEVTEESKLIRDVPIVIEQPADGLEATITSPQDGLKDITVSGPSNMLDNIDASDIKLTADASDLTAGTHQVTLQVNAPDYLTVKNSEADLTVTVQVEDTSTETSTPPTDPDTNTGEEGSGSGSTNSGSGGEEESGTNPPESESGEDANTESDPTDPAP
ncbi:CdaR family protein [Neobacillus mesonae]|nr:CdaR family protein [Neobacillus mesonae]